MNNKQIADLLFPNIQNTIMEKVDRNLPDKAMVTRFAPSPTGFMHIGNLYGALIDERLAHQSGGVFYLRIEDTDQKREVEDGVELIISSLSHFNVNFDEGATQQGEQGSYGPYRQRQRADIYQRVAKMLVAKGQAYPCFCSEIELTDMRTTQETSGLSNLGYYGKWAKHRDFTVEQIKAELDLGKQFVVRFKSTGSVDKMVNFNDMVKGNIQFPENIHDHVMLKSDGIPTYHFAHVVDDYYMGTTHVVRGEEWLATLPFHCQMFETLGWQPPKYIHTSSVMKLDETHGANNANPNQREGSKRKLSKRKDPEASLAYYKQEGMPVLSVIEYLMTLLNSNFEEWRIKNPTLPYTDFEFTTDKMSVSGALFDVVKLRDVSKNTIATFSAQQATQAVIEWAKEFDQEFYQLLTADIEYSTSLFAIGRGGEKPRKDLACWNQAKEFVNFFFDKLFKIADSFPINIDKSDIAAILTCYCEVFDQSDDQTAWFSRIKELSAELGFAPETKLYKKNPQDYKGSVGDVSMVIRIAVTGKQNSPDLHSVMRILGKEKVIERLKNAMDFAQ